MRATNHKHYAKDTTAKKAPKTSRKSHKAVKAASAGFAVVIAAAAFIVPTTTLAPGVEAYADSRVASYSVGDIDKFSSIITDNCVETTTVPETEATTVPETTVEETTVEETTAPVEEKSEPEEKPKKNSTEKATKAESKDEEESDYDYDNDEDDETSYYATESSSTKSSSNKSSKSSSGTSYSGAALVDISNPDYSYSPGHVSLSSYDRAKLERLVMGEAGSMGYTGCALVAQAIRDAMNRSGTSSIDQIISEYQYFGSTSIEPNSDVLNAVSFIFDQDGVAVQHRVMCFYIGYSAWHETQTFLTEIQGVRFFDLNF